MDSSLKIKSRYGEKDKILCQLHNAKAQNDDGFSMVAMSENIENSIMMGCLCHKANSH